MDQASPHLSRRSLAGTARAIALLCLGFSLLLQPVAAQSPRPSEADVLLDRVRKTRAEIAERRSHLDTTLLSLDGVLGELGLEVESLAAFVSDHVAYVPYRGAMLGADGVVATRRGNALDQAVLLAAMLNRAGLEARIVGAALADEDADRLIGHWLSQRSADLLPYRAGTSSARSVADAAAGPDSRFEAQEAERARIAAARERGQNYAAAVAAAAGVNLNIRDDRRELRRIASDYHWVQYRDAPFSDWSNLHPAFGSAGYGEAALPEPVSYFTGNLPDALVHRVTIRGHAERLAGGRVQRQAITADWSAPVPNLGGKPVSFTILPLDAIPGAEGENAKVFAPFVNGYRAPGAQMFDRGGNVVDMDILSMGAPGSMVDMILTMSEKGGAAAANLAGLDFGAGEEGEQEAPGGSELLRVILTIRTDGPSGSKTHERVIFDREDAGGSLVAWEDLQLAAELYRHFAFIIDGGFDAPARLLEQTMTSADGDLALNEFDLINWGRPQTPAVMEERARITAADTATPGMIYAAFAALGTPQPYVGGDAVMSAPRSPSIVAVAISPTQAGEETKLRTVIDIVSADWSLWRRSDGTGDPILLDPSLMAEFGTTITLAEAEMMGGVIDALPPGQNTETSAWSVLDRHDGEMTMLREPLNAAMAADLKKGNRIVVAGAGAGAGAGAAGGNAWWSIDPATGLVLGMTRDGGAITAEHISMLIGISMYTAFTWKGINGCVGHKNEACCMAGTAAVGVALGAAGYAGFAYMLGANFFAASGALAGAVNVTSVGMLDFAFGMGTSMVPGDFLCN